MMRNLMYIGLLFVGTIATDSLCQMHIHAYFNELFLQEPVPTEFNAYKIFMNDPLLQDVNYLAIPWTILMKKNMLHQMPDIKFDGGFTVCQHFRYEEILPILRKMGVNVLFTPHIEEGKIYKGVRVLPFPHFAKNGTNPAPIKDILYSFVGAASKQEIRERIFKLPRKNDVVIVERRAWGACTTDKENNKEYRDILARSRFALCPRGHGVSTIRFWESLQAGAIPVLLADGTMLPEEIDWSSCCVFVVEKDVVLVDEIIRSISLEQEEEMRKNCLQAYQESSGVNLVRTIRHYYDQ